MTSIYTDIRGALEKHLSDTSGLPTIAYENVYFEPTTGTPFVKTKVIPITRKPAVRGLNPQQRYSGIFRCYVYAPENTGPSVADDYADLILESFEATTDISFTNAATETIIVSIDYAERDAGHSQSPWYYIPVNIGWYIYN